MKTILPGELNPAQTGALLTGGVGPRPIALASTISPQGIRNLAPFSFFNAFGSNPPMVAFAPNRRARDGSTKDTYRNAMATKEFVIAAVTHAMLQQMNVASADYAEGVDEFVKSGLTPLAARLVGPALVGESPFQMECRLFREVELGTGPGAGLMLIGEVLAFHVREECFQEGVLHPDRLDLVGRNGGAFYTRASGRAILEVAKPVGQPIGYDALPEVLRSSRTLTGNDLGRLANSPALPEFAAALQAPGDPGDEAGLERAIHEALEREDMAEAWRLVGRRLAH